MSDAIRVDREGDHASLVLSGQFDLAHAATVAQVIESVEASLAGCCSIDVDLAQLEGIDGAGAILLARLLDRLDVDGRHASVIKSSNREAARLIVQMVADPSRAPELARAVQEAENAGDKITHETIARLHRTWITPIDRADIHALIT